MSAQNLKLIGASATKPPLGNVPDHALVGVSRVLEDSAVKYAPGNFLAQPIEDAIEAYDSGWLRHRLRCRPLSGVVNAAAYAALDDDSGLPHIDHMIAGLIILRTLMIRDGVLPEDPGMGKRKRASFEASRMVEASYHMGIVPGDVPPLPSLADDDAPNEALRRLASRIAHDYPKPLTGSDWYTCQEHNSDTCLHDPDTDRRLAAERNLEQLKVDQARAAEEKRKWEHRCLACNATGKTDDEICYRCKGTGERTGAEGVRL